MKTLKTISKSLAVALLLTTPSAAVFAVSATPAAAERGGNGNGNGNGRANGNRGNSNREARVSGSRGNGGGGNNGRGAIARELQGLNAAHANQRALESASPDSMPGKLYAYQQATLAIGASEQAVADAGAMYQALQNMTEERFNELNPTLDYSSTLQQAGQDYQAALNNLAMAQSDADVSLMALTGGRQLSNAAMNELMAMLGS